LATFFLCAAEFAKQHGQRIVKFVHHALLERNDGVVSDANLLGTNLRATLRDIAETDTELILEQGGAVATVERMHLKTGNANEKTRSGKLLFLIVLAKNVTHVLAEKTFDAFAELLHAIHVQLGNFPFDTGPRFERRDFTVDTIIPGYVGDKVFNSGERFHREDGDGLVLREVIHARLAGQARATVDLGGTGATPPRLAVPADGEIGSEMALDVVERVEYDHAGSDGH